MNEWYSECSFDFFLTKSNENLIFQKFKNDSFGPPVYLKMVPKLVGKFHLCLTCLLSFITIGATVRESSRHKQTDIHIGGQVLQISGVKTCTLLCFVYQKSIFFGGEWKTIPRNLISDGGRDARTGSTFNNNVEIKLGRYV